MKNSDQKVAKLLENLEKLLKTKDFAVKDRFVKHYFTNFCSDFVPDDLPPNIGYINREFGSYDRCKCKEVEIKINYSDNEFVKMILEDFSPTPGGLPTKICLEGYRIFFKPAVIKRKEIKEEFKLKESSILEKRSTYEKMVRYKIYELQYKYNINFDYENLEFDYDSMYKLHDHWYKLEEKEGTLKIYALEDTSLYKFLTK